jgi:hypothetical protein
MVLQEILARWGQPVFDYEEPNIADNPLKLLPPFNAQ